MAPRMCLAMQASIVSSRCCAGTATTASDTSSGRSATEAWHGWSPSMVRAGLTACTGTLVFAVTLSQMAAPTEPGRSDAPITAIARGIRRRTTARESARCSRRSTLSRNSSVVASSQSRSTTPRVEAALQRPARLGEHGEHRPVVGQHLGGEPVDAVRPGDRREVLEQERRDALALVGVVDHERGFGLGTAWPALVARPGDELAVRLDDEGDAVDHVDVGEVVEIRARSALASARSTGDRCCPWTAGGETSRGRRGRPA